LFKDYNDEEINDENTNSVEPEEEQSYNGSSYWKVGLREDS